MYEVKKKWINGYAVLPCFTVKILEGTQGAEFTCNETLQFIFEHIIAPFWNGKIHVIKTSNLTGRVERMQNEQL